MSPPLSEHAIGRTASSRVTNITASDAAAPHEQPGPQRATSSVSVATCAGLTLVHPQVSSQRPSPGRPARLVAVARSCAAKPTCSSLWRSTSMTLAFTSDGKIGRAHVCTPVPNAPLVFRLLPADNQLHPLHYTTP